MSIFFKKIIILIILFYSMPAVAEEQSGEYEVIFKMERYEKGKVVYSYKDPVTERITSPFPNADYCVKWAPTFNYENEYVLSVACYSKGINEDKVIDLVSVKCNRFIIGDYVKNTLTSLNDKNGFVLQCATTGNYLENLSKFQWFDVKHDNVLLKLIQQKLFKNKKETI